jgi:SAM-dependent methyltransferase
MFVSMQSTGMRKRYTLTAILALALLAPVAADAQGRHPVSGRVIAGVMGVGGAPWLERPEREFEESPGRAVRLLGLKPGMVAADVGAGSGYYTYLLSKAVGPSGKVIATDIQPGMLRLLEKKLRSSKIKNVELVQGAEDDPMLPEACCDLILMVDVYHEFARPQEMLRKLRGALKPEGRLVLLEFRKEDPGVPIREEHKMSVAEARLELEHEGYTFEKVLNDLPWQHMLFFRP